MRSTSCEGVDSGRNDMTEALARMEDDRRSRAARGEGDHRLRAVGSRIQIAALDGSQRRQAYVGGSIEHGRCELARRLAFRLDEPRHFERTVFAFDDARGERVADEVNFCRDELLRRNYL